MSNSAAAAHRRLRAKRPDLYARVLAGELTAHAAMVAAGIRKPRARDPKPDLTMLRRAWERASPEERDTFLADIGAVFLRGKEEARSRASRRSKVFRP